MKTEQLENIGDEQCRLKFALKDANLEEGTFTGIASVFGSEVDAWIPTIIEPGAFTKTLQENSSRIKLLWQHDVHEPIGLPKKLEETVEGLEVTGKISQTARGKDALVLVRDNVISELSIGFDPIRYELENFEDGSVMRHVKELRLWEISLVTFAADPKAKIQSVHAVVPFQNLPLADEGRSWDASAAKKRLKEKCDLQGKKPDWTQFKKAHCWFDADDPGKMGSYKFPIADVIDDKLKAVPRAIFAAAARINSATIPEEDVPKLKRHLGRYYKVMDRKAPWDKDKDSKELALEILHAFVPQDAHEGKPFQVLSDAITRPVSKTVEPPKDKEPAALTVDDGLCQLARVKRYFAQSNS